MAHDTTSDAGITRRSLIARSAVAGGAVLWATPVVQSFASPALGATGTPRDKQISYLAFFYQCVGEPPVGAKVEIGPGGPMCQGTAAPETPGCSLDVPAGAQAADCADLDVAVSADGRTVTVSFVGPGGAAFLDSVAKCGQPGNPSSGGDCVDGVVSGFTLTFGPCG